MAPIATEEPSVEREMNQPIKLKIGLPLGVSTNLLPAARSLIPFVHANISPKVAVAKRTNIVCREGYGSVKSVTCAGRVDTRSNLRLPPSTQANTCMYLESVPP